MNGELALVDDLAPLAEQINIHIQQAESAARDAVTAALAAGELLNRAKAKVAHGEWEAWVMSHCTVAPRTARAYMSLAKRVPLLTGAERQRVADLPLREAIAAVATTPETPPRIKRIKFDIGVASRLHDRLKSNSNSLNSLARSVLSGRVDAKRLRTMRERLLETIAVIDSMETGA